MLKKKMIIFGKHRLNELNLQSRENFAFLLVCVLIYQIYNLNMSYKTARVVMTAPRTLFFPLSLNLTTKLMRH